MAFALFTTIAYRRVRVGRVLVFRFTRPPEISSNGQFPSYAVENNRNTDRVKSVKIYIFLDFRFSRACTKNYCFVTSVRDSACMCY